ncbi:hypothetical protein SCORR_v1c10170 (plasmid) [Spiroplasma corruscae]|uniref:Uncharacterized protein n=1 Tax=Spiroplasma corruscae TaxID=216934 RepID=A0A222EQI1_9MOLU|nr:hypothetical protein [Spiroplasma corruscae]ASP28789.1 hypothetical protein SCORR_v1c10170 [Spiroplasma corruscae]
MTKYKIGDWVVLYSPISGDKSKKNKGQETRFGFIYNVQTTREKKSKYSIQMLSNKDSQNTNWEYVRRNGTSIKSRNYYNVKVKETFIIRKTFKFEKLSLQEIYDLKKIINKAKAKENVKKVFGSTLQVNKNRTFEDIKRSKAIEKKKEIKK